MIEPLNDSDHRSLWKASWCACLALATLLLILMFVIVVRLRLLQIPLSRDEGEFAYMGQLILNGIPPYDQAYNMKLPGIYLAYACILLLGGQTIASIHLGLLVINVVSIVILIYLGKRLFGPLAGMIAGASYAVLSLSPSVQGTAADASHFVVVAAVAGIGVGLKGLDSGRLWHYAASGFFLGLAFLMKQPGLMFGLFMGIYLAAKLVAQPLPTRIACLLCYGAGWLLPFVVSCLVLYRVGVFPKFWFWTFAYAYAYGTQLTFFQGLQQLSLRLPQVVAGFYAMWALAAIGLWVTWKNKIQRWFVPLFLLFSCLAVAPGLYFREHYFVLLLPGISLAVGAAIQFLSEVNHKRLSLLGLTIFWISLLFGIWWHAPFFFQYSPVQACRSLYFFSPFPESIKIAQFLKANTKPQDTIGVIGSEPQIYFYAQRQGATGYLYTYALMEPQPYASQMQQEMISEIEKARPPYLVLVNIHHSWLVRLGSDRTILAWAEQYTKKYYEIVGVADIISNTETIYQWALDAVTYTPRSSCHVYILQRKTLGPRRKLSIPE